MKRGCLVSSLLSLFALAACDSSASQPDPSGTHTSASRVIVQYEPRPPGLAFDGEMPSVATVGRETGDVFKVTFGDCWARVKRPKVPNHWKVIEGSACTTKLGVVKITGGEMLVFDEGRMTFAFEGTGPDGKTAVKFVFTGALKS